MKGIMNSDTEDFGEEIHSSTGLCLLSSSDILK